MHTKGEYLQREPSYYCDFVESSTCTIHYDCVYISFYNATHWLLPLFALLDQGICDPWYHIPPESRPNCSDEGWYDIWSGNVQTVAGSWRRLCWLHPGVPTRARRGGGGGWRQFGPRRSAGKYMPMMMSWHGNASRITGPLWGESTCGFPSQRVSNAAFVFS